MNFPKKLYKWLCATGYCTDCRHLHSDQFGNMCLYSSPRYRKPAQEQVIKGKKCNLWEYEKTIKEDQ